MCVKGAKRDGKMLDQQIKIAKMEEMIFGNHEVQISSKKVSQPYRKNNLFIFRFGVYARWVSI